MITSAGTAWRTYREGDESSINDAYGKAYGVSRSVDDWAWRFPPEVDGRAIVLAEVDGNVVAHCAGIPVRVAIDGRELKAVRVVDAFATTHDSLGPEPANPSSHIFTAFFDEFGSRGRFRLAFGLYRPGDDTDSFPPVGFEGAIEHSIRALVRKRPVPAPRRRLLYRAEAARDWEPRLDDLWKRVRGSYPVAVVRDAENALRRFAGRCGVRYRRFLVLPRFSSRAVAFAVFRTDNKKCRWVDLLWDRDHPRSLGLLARISARLASEASAAKEEIWIKGDPEGRRQLESLGFSEIEGNVLPAMAARSFASDVDASVFVERAYLTMADTDEA